MGKNSDSGVVVLGCRIGGTIVILGRLYDRLARLEQMPFGDDLQITYMLCHPLFGDVIDVVLPMVGTSSTLTLHFDGIRSSLTRFPLFPHLYFGSHHHNAKSLSLVSASEYLW